MFAALLAAMRRIREANETGTWKAIPGMPMRHPKQGLESPQDGPPVCPRRMGVYLEFRPYAMNEKRLFTRIASSLEVDLRLPNGDALVGRLKNLSIRGLYIEAKVFPPAGTRCSVVLYPAGREHGFVIEIEGLITRFEDGGMGVRFNEFCYSAFDRLRAMIVASADDADKIDQEIDEHMSGKRKAQ